MDEGRPPSPSPSTGYVYAAFAAASAGFLCTVAKLGLAEMPPLTFAFWAFLFGAPFSALWMRSRTKVWSFPRSRNALLVLFTQTIASFAAIWGTYAGLALLDPTVASFVGRTETVFAILLAVVLLGERFRPLEGAGAAVAVAGLVVMRLPALSGAGGAGSATGFWLVLLGAAGFGVAELLAKISVRYISATTFSFYRLLILVPLFALAATADGHLAVPSTKGLLVAALAGLLGPVGARTFFMLSLERIDLSRSVIVGQAQPLFAAALAFVLIDRIPGPVEWLGGALIVAGCVTLFLAAPKPRPGSPPAKILAARRRR